MSKLRKYQVEASKRDLLTPKDTIAAVKKARLILVSVRFGLSEDSVKLTKPEALSFLTECFKNNMDITPDRFEMYSGRFGYVEGDTVYLG